ncbi:MAG: hypothetical protein ACU84H_06485 [Gammaproteobacteria bacterium]
MIENGLLLVIGVWSEYPFQQGKHRTNNNQQANYASRRFQSLSQI